MASNGGINAPLNLWILPTFVPGDFFTLDVSDFNDPLKPSFYTWKIEDIIAGRTGTINRLIVSYKDLGEVTVQWTLSGTNDAGEVVSNSTGDYVMGSVAADGKIKTCLPGISLTAQNLQLRVDRAADAGPLCITKIRMEGRVETTKYG